MNRIYKKLIVATACISLCLVSCFSYLGCEKGCFEREKIIRPSAPSEKKFEAISKWIPESANALLTLDIYKLTRSNLWGNLVNLNRKDLWTKLEKAGINFQSDIGMVTLFMQISSPLNIKGPVMIIQGGFHQDVFVERIKKWAGEEGIELKSEKYKDFQIYTDEWGIFGTPYAFTALKNGMLAAAWVDDLKWIIDYQASKTVPRREKVDKIKQPIWGEMIVTPQAAETVPPPWNSIERVKLTAQITDDLEAQIVAKVKEGEDAEKVKTALEGFKAIEAIQMMDDEEMLAAIEKIEITDRRQEIIIKIPKEMRFINLILPKETETEPEKEETKKDETQGKEN